MDGYNNSFDTMVNGEMHTTSALAKESIRLDFKNLCRAYLKTIGAGLIGGLIAVGIMYLMKMEKQEMIIPALIIAALVAVIALPIQIYKNLSYMFRRTGGFLGKIAGANISLETGLYDKSFVNTVLVVQFLLLFFVQIPALIFCIGYMSF